MIRYFVSYSHTLGFGRAQLTLPRPVTTIDDIFAIERHLSATNGLAGVSVLHFQRFDDTEPAPEGAPA